MMNKAHVTTTPRFTGFGSTIAKIAGVMLVAEVLIMWVLYWLEVSPFDWKLALLDAGFLTAVVSGIAYFGFTRPKDRQIAGALAALAEATAEAEKLARFDALTGVLSRRPLLEALDVEVERAGRYGRALTCIMLDLDHFKAINDAHGHLFGDKALRHIAQVISEHCRKNDHFGRYGGEEFLIILPETPMDAAMKLAERVRSAVANTHLAGSEQRVTISLGLAEWHAGEGSAHRLVSQADTALLAAKAAGRNRIMA